MPETNTDASADTARFQAFKDRGDDLPPAWEMKAQRSNIGLLALIVLGAAVLAGIFGFLLIG